MRPVCTLFEQPLACYGLRTGGYLVDQRVRTSVTIHQSTLRIELQGAYCC